MQTLSRPPRAPERGHALDLPTWLAYAYSPLLPTLKRFKLVRRARRAPDPSDVLVPRGYVAEVVATGLTTPVHCTFDDRGSCYVFEGGHKVDTRPHPQGGYPQRPDEHVL